MKNLTLVLVKYEYMFLLYYCNNIRIISFNVTPLMFKKNKLVIKVSFF